jgi:hypothetical protein
VLSFLPPRVAKRGVVLDQVEAGIDYLELAPHAPDHGAHVAPHPLLAVACVEVRAMPDCVIQRAAAHELPVGVHQLGDHAVLTRGQADVHALPVDVLGGVVDRQRLV